MGTDSGTTWAVVGNSPSGARFISHVPEDAVAITHNSGIELFARRRLDYYLLFDDAACRKHIKQAYAAQATGTKLITHTHQQRQIEEFGLGGFDIFLPMGSPTPSLFTRGQFTTQLSLSGMYTLAFAINSGARRVLMLGMDGYANRTAGKMRNCFRPMTQAMIDACPDVEFILWGTPGYEISGPNLTIQGEPSANQNAEAVSCA